MFGHDDHQNFFVRFGIVGGRISFKVGRVKLPANRARPKGSIARSRHHRFRFGARVDHGDDNPPRADIEHALDVFRAIDRNSHQRNGSGPADNGQAFRGRFEAGGSMFQFDGQPIKANTRHQSGGHWIRQRQPGSNAWFAPLEFGSDMISFHKQLSTLNH